MLKLVVGIFLVGLIVSVVISEDREAEQQALRNREQIELLIGMERLNTPAVSKLVDDWRQTYPEPEEEKIAELRVMAERVKADPSQAFAFTTDGKQQKLDKLNNVLVGIGGPVKAEGPGLN